MVLSLFPLQVAMCHTQLAPFKSMPILRPLGAATELTSVMMIDELPANPPTYVCLCYMPTTHKQASFQLFCHGSYFTIDSTFSWFLILPFFCFQNGEHIKINARTSRKQKVIDIISYYSR
jgi:hypothetical protein